MLLEAWAMHELKRSQRQKYGPQRPVQDAIVFAE